MIGAYDIFAGDITSENPEILPSETSEMENLYSDHTLFGLNDCLKVNQLNVAQPNCMQFFANRFCPEGFNWSTVLRTPKMLQLIRANKDRLNALVPPLQEIAQRSDISLQEKNALMEDACLKLIPTIEAMAFPVKSLSMIPHKLFNADATPNELREFPERYIKGPFYALEDAESYTSRLERAFADFMTDNPDFITTQEITLGIENHINYSEIHQQIAKRYVDYGYVMPDLINNNFITLNVTYFNKNKWADASESYPEHIAFIKEKMKCFGDSDVKNLVSAFKNNDTNEIWYVANIHADYGKANKLAGSEAIDPWLVLRELLLSTPRLIIAGDFNLQLKNINYLDSKVNDIGVLFTIMKTPESEDFNPTYDAIFISGK